MRRVLFGLSLIVFLTSFGPPALTEFVPRRTPVSMSLGELIDLLTPFLVIGGVLLLMWHIKRARVGAVLALPEVIPLAITAAFAISMTSGHGIHLAANSLSHFLSAESGGTLYQLNYLYDEVVSHYLWHVGAFGLSAGAALYQLKYPTSEQHAAAAWVLPSSLLYAFTFTFATIEGETVPAILPLTLLTLAGFLFAVKRRGIPLRPRPVLIFYLLNCALMLAGWMGYAIAFGGLIPPTTLIGAH